MSANVQAYDMGRFWRLVSVDGGRVTGTFWVSHNADGEPHSVRSVDVTVWADEQHSWGRTLYSDSLTAFISGDEIRIPKHMIRERVRDDVLDAMDAMTNAIRLAVAAAAEAGAAMTVPAHTNTTNAAEVDQRVRAVLFDTTTYSRWAAHDQETVDRVVKALRTAGLLADPTTRTKAEYAVEYGTDSGPSVGSITTSLRRAERDAADWFDRTGCPARVVRRTVTDWTPAEEGPDD